MEGYLSQGEQGKQGSQLTPKALAIWEALTGQEKDSEATWCQFVSAKTLSGFRATTWARMISSAAKILTGKQTRTLDCRARAGVHRGEWTDPNAAKVTINQLFPSWLATRSVKPTTRQGYQEIYDSLNTCTDLFDGELDGVATE